jgi:hypothetical protein
MREQQSVRPAPPRRMSAKQMNSSLLSGVFDGCNGSFYDARPRKSELAVTDRPRSGRAGYNMKQLFRPTMIFLKRILG